MPKIKVHLLDLKGYYESPAYQLGLLVAAVRADPDLSQHFEFVITEHSRFEPVSKILATIAREGAGVLGASCYAWTHRRVVQILTALDGAACAPKHIIIGGPSTAGEFGQTLLREHRNISVVAVGEGEPAFVDICRRLAGGSTELAGARNCLTLGDVPDACDLGHRVTNLDDTPSPYLLGLLPVDPSPIFLETNRGCPYRCSFCYWGNGQSRIHQMSQERFGEEIRFMLGKGVTSLWLADANFGIFPGDAEIAALIRHENEKAGRPLRMVGVNWAKQSSDRVMDIAATFADAGIGCATTLALQTVTPRAEKLSRRYSLPPERFISLVSASHERGIAAYTDVIWGLPGETVGEFLTGLESVSMSGVPGVMAHQLSLLPGTELFDRREELGVEISGPRTGEDAGVYRDYVVVAHRDMTPEDMARGTRLMAVNHLIHNHNLGRITTAYLARYGLGIPDVYEAMVDLLAEPESVDDPMVSAMLVDLADTIETFTRDIGRDETLFFRELSEQVWFRDGLKRDRRVSWPVPLELMRTLFDRVCRASGLSFGLDELALLDEVVRFNALVAPKPMFKQRETVTFRWDVARLWSLVRQEIHKRPPKGQTWKERRGDLRARIAAQLSPDRIDALERPSTFTVDNPFRLPPSVSNIDWVLTAAHRECRLIPVDDGASSH